MGTHLKLSVIVPVYNVERHIEKCVRSLFQQTLDGVEFIFVDDCSTDDSISILQSLVVEYQNLADNVIVIRHKQNRGVSVARNTGLARARGEYVIFLDSDDWTEVHMLQKMYLAALTAKADVVMCDFAMVLKSGTKCYKLPTWDNSDKVTSMQQYLRFAWTVVWCMLIKRELCICHNLYFASGYIYCEDFNFAVKVLNCATRVVNIHEPLYYYNQLNVNSVMHRLDDKTMCSEQEMYEDVIDWFKRKGAFDSYRKEMSWRILKSKQELVLNTATYNDFLSIFPESHDYIWSCPWLNFKLKLMMWCLVHHLGFISRVMLKLRGIKVLLHK